MIIYFYLLIFCLLFSYITWRHFYLGLASLFFLLPTYLIRFNLGPLPSTLLEIMIWIIFIIWIIKYHRSIINNLISTIKNNYNYTLFIATFFFLVASTISIFTSIDLRAAAGEWKAFYIEPIIIFLILITTIKTKKQINNIIYALVLSGLITALLAIYQHFTGWLVPYSFWQNRNTFRVTGWYGFPNAVGLFLAPLLPLTMYLIKEQINKLNKVESKKYKVKNYLLTVFFLLSNFAFLLAIIFAKNTGALIGALLGIILILVYYKKTRRLTIGASILGIITLILIFTETNILKNQLSLKQYSGSLRLNMWAETVELLKTYPIKGAGLSSYSETIYPYRIDKWVEVFHHPHNLFLTMWVNLGLLGVVAFVWIIVSFFRIAFIKVEKSFKNKFACKWQINNFNIFIIASMLVILVMGLIDSPYIKNDLAILFWLLPALLIISNKYELEKS